MTNQEFGKWAENMVTKLYSDKGFEIITQNFQFYSKGRSGRNGELDIVCTKDNILIIVEVKARMTNSFGNALEQISQQKLQTLFYTIQYFLLKNPQFQNLPIRFDVAGVSPKKIQILANVYNFDGFLR